MPTTGCPKSPDIGFPVVPAVAPPAVMPAVAPAAVMPAVAPAAVAPARMPPAAVVPARAVVVPPCQLLLGIDLDERAALLGGLCGRIRNGFTDRLKALGHLAGFVRRLPRGHRRHRVG